MTPIHIKLYNEAFIAASGQYLTDYLPDEFPTWERDQMHEFVNDHAWEGVETLPADEIISQISQAADAMVRFYKEQLEKLKAPVLNLSATKHERRVFIQIINTAVKNA